MAPLIGITTHPSSAGADAADQLPAQQAYVDAVARAGGLPVVIPLGLGEHTLRALFTRLDGLLLSGGGDIDPGRFGARPIDGLRSLDPSRDSLEIQLVRWAIEDEKPVFGICRGLQAINVALGGSLIQDIPSQFADALDHDLSGRPAAQLAHPVRIEADSTLARLLGAASLDVNSSHHQAVLDLAPGWRATAHAPDGIVEAIEWDGHLFALGVQWHPERLPQRADSVRLFEAFVRACSGE